MQSSSGRHTYVETQIKKKYKEKVQRNASKVLQGPYNRSYQKRLKDMELFCLMQLKQRGQLI